MPEVSRVHRGLGSSSIAGRTLVAVRAFRDEPSLAAGRVSGHHQILVIHAPRARSRLNAALISARWVSIGEFSRLSRLSPKALRLYDKLGLLVPDHVDAATGYRWYPDTQLDQARLVALLRARPGQPSERGRRQSAWPDRTGSWTMPTRNPAHAGSRRILAAGWRPLYTMPPAAPGRPPTHPAHRQTVPVHAMD